jgi:hypothetical protein
MSSTTPGAPRLDPIELARQVEQLDEEDWYDFLDELDAVSRRRREREPEAPEPTGESRDEVAAWVARTHSIVDSGIREVWYLPAGAPSDEIRLLEVSDRLAGPEGKVGALNLGLDFQGVPFSLLVADITSEQLEHLRRDSSLLPEGWSLEGESGLEAAAVTEHQRLFLIQARTDFAVFELLWDHPDLPTCHALHHLQMATEMHGKAHV